MAAKRKKARKSRSKPRPRKKNPTPAAPPFFSAEFTDKLKGAASAVLGEVERDPEKALDKLGHLGRELKRVVEQNPRGTTQLIKNVAIAGIAQALKKGLEK